MIQPIGLVNGHYECRSLSETLPILRDLVCLEPVGERSGVVIVKHPNTGWQLVVHEGGRDAPDKPRTNHYGVRVATNREVDNAHEYLRARMAELRIEVDHTQNRHLAHSVHFAEPGGNWWEIESYEAAVKIGLGANVSVPWKTPLAEEKFPGRGYVPQALTHGTITCNNLEASRRFYTEVLGLETVSPSPAVKPHYIKHPSTPWYVVSLEMATEKRRLLTQRQRYTVALESAGAVAEAHRWLTEEGRSLGVTELEEIREEEGIVSFLLSDPDRNWWEIASPEVSEI